MNTEVFSDSRLYWGLFMWHRWDILCSLFLEC